MNETIQTILHRRSIRAYKPEQIKDEELELILKAGSYAPSAINQQSWHFTVVQNQEAMRKISEACRAVFLNSGNKMFEERAKSPNFSISYNAPTLIIVSGNEKNILPQIDCSLALGNMFLAAASIGIGSCWIHALTQVFAVEESKTLKEELGIPEGYAVYCSGAFGYSAVEDPKAPPRKENIVNIIK